ncbi:MAG TPA: hypothetical protein VGL19_08800 [Polyangiaceae bacterium]
MAGAGARLLSRFSRGIAAISGLALLAGSPLGCRKAAQPLAADAGSPLAPSASPEAAPAVASALPPVGLTWVDPPGLRRVPPLSSSQKASYLVPRAAGDSEDGEVFVFHLGPGQGGPVDTNLDRGVSEFSDVNPSDVKRAEHEANGAHRLTVEIREGTFDPGPASPGSPGPKKGYALEGAIVEGPSGAYLFKMTGPARTIAAGRLAFIQLLDSVHRVRPDH